MVGRADSTTRHSDMAEVLLSSRGLHEQLYGRRYHKEQHSLRLCGGLEKLDVSLPYFYADKSIFTQIV